MSTSDHDVLRDLVAAVALGAATPEEEARVETHAAACAACREDLAAFRVASAGIGLSAPPVEPPPELRERILDEVRADAARRLPEPRDARTPGRRSFLDGLRARPWPALAGALAALALGLLGWNVALQAGGDGDGRLLSIAVRGTAEAPGIAGRILYIADEDTAVMRLTNLPEIASGLEWELWAIGAGGRPVSRGFMTRTGGREAVVATAHLEGVTALAVTPERTDNTVAPTGPPRAVVELPEQG
jgi:anti-sigma-K factor RskA